MKSSYLFLCLVVLSLVGQVVKSQKEPDWCGKIEIEKPTECGAKEGSACMKCSECKGGRISRGYRPLEKIAEEAKDSGEDSPGILCVTIWAWLAPVLVVILIGVGVGV